MKALLLQDKNKWTEMKVEEIEKPLPNKGEVVVEVHAVGLNPVDYKTATNGNPYWTYPHILGLDVAGTIEFKMTASSPDALPVVKIGSPVEYFTEQALERIKDAGIRCYSQFGIASVLLEKIQSDEIDIAITTQRLQIPGIEYTVIEEEEFVLTVPPSFEMTPSKDVEEFLYNQRWISYGLELPIIRRFWRQHFKKRPEIQPHHVIPNLQTVLKAIQHHMGISLLPRYLIQEALREKKVKIELEHLAVKNQIFLAYKLKHRDHPTIQKTIRCLKKETSAD